MGALLDCLFSPIEERSAKDSEESDSDGVPGGGSAGARASEPEGDPVPPRLYRPEDRLEAAIDVDRYARRIGQTLTESVALEILPREPVVAGL
jgi:hypothetical protein